MHKLLATLFFVSLAGSFPLSAAAAGGHYSTPPPRFVHARSKWVGLIADDDDFHDWDDDRAPDFDGTPDFDWSIGMPFSIPTPIYPYSSSYFPGPTTYLYSPPAAPRPPIKPPVQYWYYCHAPTGYYPYVRKCPQGWTKVPITPPSHSP